MFLLIAIPAAAAEPFRDPDLPLEQRVQDLISRLTLEEKANLLNHRGPEVARFHILSDNWNQCLHGLRWNGGPTTLFPIPTGMASTWDPELVQRVADATSDEARAIYNAWHDDPQFAGERAGLIYRSPVINILRNPYWGRNGEAWSEDPFLCGRMAVAFVHGLQGNDPRYLKLAATVKHFCVNNVEKDRKRLSATVSERMLHDYWLPHWEEAVREGGACSVMASYNQINGVHNVYNEPLLTGILKKDWGFSGFVVSDLGGVYDKEMVIKAVNAGCDFSDKHFMDFLPAAVREGSVSEARLNEALARVLRIRFRLGEFDPAERVPWRRIPMSVVCSSEHHALSLQASRESLVLLKNDRLLPLDPARVRKIAVIGPMAETVYQGDSNYIGAPNRKTIGIVAGLREQLPGAEVLFANGGYVSKPTPDEGIQLQKAVDAATSADAAVVCVGTDGAIEHEGHDRQTLALPGNQEALVEAVIHANPRTVVVLVNAGPLTVPWIKAHAPAILCAWWSGEAQGQAVAEALLGKINPAGRLPYTVYASEAQVPPQDEYDISKGFTYMYVKGESLFPFGYGLSYTTFEYSDLKVSGTPLTVNVSVKNTGSRPGDEVVQLYLKPPQSDEPRPRRMLRGFRRVKLAPGETQVVNFTAPDEKLAFWNVDKHAFATARGEWRDEIGASSEDIRLQAGFTR